VEIGSIDPHPMEDDADLTSEGDFGAAALGDGDGPALSLDQVTTRVISTWTASKSATRTARSPAWLMMPV